MFSRHKGFFFDFLNPLHVQFSIQIKYYLAIFFVHVLKLLFRKSQDSEKKIFGVGD